MSKIEKSMIDKGWEDMTILLDSELPINKNKDRILWLLLLALVLVSGAFIWYYISMEEWKENIDIAQQEQAMADVSDIAISATKELVFNSDIAKNTDATVTTTDSKNSELNKQNSTSYTSTHTPRSTSHQLNDESNAFTNQDGKGIQNSETTVQDGRDIARSAQKPQSPISSLQVAQINSEKLERKSGDERLSIAYNSTTNSAKTPYSTTYSISDDKSLLAIAALPLRDNMSIETELPYLPHTSIEIVSELHNPRPKVAFQIGQYIKTSNNLKYAKPIAISETTAAAVMSITSRWKLSAGLGYSFYKLPTNDTRIYDRSGEFSDNFSFVNESVAFNSLLKLKVHQVNFNLGAEFLVLPKLGIELGSSVKKSWNSGLKTNDPTIANNSNYTLDKTLYPGIKSSFPRLLNIAGRLGVNFHINDKLSLNAHFEQDFVRFSPSQQTVETAALISPEQSKLVSDNPYASYSGIGLKYTF